eukprot:jgi/Ulvmu1/3156/UM015_0196.1
MRNITTFYRSNTGVQMVETQAQPCCERNQSTEGQPSTVRCHDGVGKDRAGGAPRSRHTVVDRSSNNARAQPCHDIAPNVLHDSSEALHAHKEDYRHWSNFMCSQADGISADAPKVQYMLEERPTDRPYASAPARLTPSLACPRITPAQIVSDGEPATTGTALLESAASEHTAAWLPSIPQSMHGKARSDQPEDNSWVAAEPQAACKVPLHPLEQQFDASQCTPERRAAGDCKAQDDYPDTSVTLAASTPSIAWKTPAAGQDVVQYAADCEGLTSCLQDVTPILTAHDTVQTTIVPVRQRAVLPDRATPLVAVDHTAGCPMHSLHAAAAKGGSQAASSPAHATCEFAPSNCADVPAADLGGAAIHVAVAEPQSSAGPLICSTKAAGASPTSSLDSDVLDDMLAAISSPESARRRDEGQPLLAMSTLCAAGKGPSSHAVPQAEQPRSCGRTSAMEDLAAALVPTGRLDAQQHAVFKQLLQWGSGGLAPSLKHERVTLLHKVTEVLQPEPGELRLRLLHVASGAHRWAHLYEGWEYTEVAVGDTANVIVAQEQWVPAADGELHCVINASGGSLFVLHPDMLISGTSIATALRCPRQAMLQEKGVGSPSRSACLGTLMHELTQAALLALSQGRLGSHEASARMHRPAPFPRRNGDRTATAVWHFMIDLIPKLVADNVMQLTEVGLTQREAEHELRQASGQLSRTLASHFRQAPLHTGPGALHAPKASIEAVLDIEESIWAPRFGLKGVIDATTVSHVKSKASHGGSERSGADSSIFGVAALEFKSGKVFHSHAAQLGLYSLLLQSRYGADPVSGLLWYSRVENMDTVSLRSNDVAGLIMTRNRLAAHKARGAWALPPPLKELHSCSSCMVLPLCAVAHHAMEGGSAKTFGLEQQYAKLTSHLSEGGSTFFQHWLHLLDVEQAEDRIPQSNIWAVEPPPHTVLAPRGVKRVLDSSERHDAVDRDESENISPNSQPLSVPGERRPKSATQCLKVCDDLELSQASEPQHLLAGRCIGSLIVHNFNGDCSDIALYPFVYTFTQSQEVTEGEAVCELKPLSSQGFSVGDCGILSVHDGHVAVNRARVLSVTTTELKLALRSQLSPVLTRIPRPGGCQRAVGQHVSSQLLWRLDKDEPETAFQCAVSGLLELMVTQSAHVERMRGLLVHHDAPRHSAKDNYANELPAEEDCVQAMLESEMQQTLPHLCGAGTPHTRGHSAPAQRGVMPSHQQPHHWSNVSAPPGPSQPYCKGPHGPPHPAMPGSCPPARQSCFAHPAQPHPVSQRGVSAPVAHTQHIQRVPHSSFAAQRPQVAVSAPGGHAPPFQARACSAPLHPLHSQLSWQAQPPLPACGPHRHSAMHNNSVRPAGQAPDPIQLSHSQLRWAPGAVARAMPPVPTFQQPVQYAHDPMASHAGYADTPAQRRMASGATSLTRDRLFVQHIPPPCAVSSQLRGSSDVAPSALPHMGHAHPPHAQTRPQGSAQPCTGPPVQLTAEQQEVVDRALAWDDYVLVMGLPGAGKTYTIAACVQALVAQGRSVLLSAYTNAALDNMLRRLVQLGETRLLRLGRSDSVHPEVAPYVLRVPNTGTQSAALAIRQNVRDVPVVGVTCLSAARAPLLRSRLFDVCILDEATQVTLPASLSPILRARTFVLVGDHLQLPPLVRSRQAEAGGLGESLFKTLSKKHPQAVVTLKSQHRMCAPIMALSNELTYDHRLRAATSAVAAARMHLPIKGPASKRFWLQQVVAADPAVMWLDTRKVSVAAERKGCNSFCNPTEAIIAKQVVHLLLSMGADGSDIGVTSPYNHQVRVLSNAIKVLSRSGGEQPRVDSDAHLHGTDDQQARKQLQAAHRVAVMTIDKFQGQDKSAMVISLVRSNADKHTGTLLQDCRRINVALTRAKHKLVLVGNSDTLCNVNMLSQAFVAIKRSGLTVDLTDDDISA